MRKLIIAATLIIGGLTGGAANAMPIGPVAAPATSNVIRVDWACGRGYHLSPRGFCRPNRWAPPPPRRHYGWDRPHRPHHWGRHERWEYGGGRYWR